MIKSTCDKHEYLITYEHRSYTEECPLCLAENDIHDKDIELQEMDNKDSERYNEISKLKDMVLEARELLDMKCSADDYIIRGREWRDKVYHYELDDL